MTTALKRDFNARIVPTWAALALIGVGAVLRLVRLDAMEFKRDEQEILQLAVQLASDLPWLAAHGWPQHGIMSSNGVPNAPLFTWIVAALWAPVRDPVSIVRLIAIINVVSLYPLWRWMRRHMTEASALIALAICAVSPFFVIYSRKLWNPDLLLPCVLLVLWGVEWLRCGRPWRGIAWLLLASLFLGQLHQSGPIAMALLPVAFAAQMVHDRQQGRPFRFGKPSTGDAVLIAIATALTLVFWVPYLVYLARLPAGLLSGRPTLRVVTPDLFLRVEAQIVPLDLLSFFAPDRDDFLRDPARATIYYASLVLGTPLLLYGVWRWLRAPFSVPVVGVWWGLIIAAFAIARIPAHPFYVLTLLPITALLPAGGFDPNVEASLVRKLLLPWRAAYVAALLALTIVTGSWLIQRGGAAGDYGIAYFHRKAQAELIVSRSPGVYVRPPPFTCALPPPEVTWLVEHLAPNRTYTRALPYLCAAWIARDGNLTYEWVMKR